MRSNLIHFFLVSVLACARPSESSLAGKGEPPSPKLSPDSPPPATSPGMAQTPASTGQDGWLACSVDADCVVVEIGCCNHCNGGRVIAVNKSASSAAVTKYKPKACSGECTERG